MAFFARLKYSPGEMKERFVRGDVAVHAPYA